MWMGLGLWDKELQGSVSSIFYYITVIQNQLFRRGLVHPFASDSLEKVIRSRATPICPLATHFCLN